MATRKNPFPGMNPYLEQVWSDVHVALIGFIRVDLSIELPEDLTARAEEKVDVLVDDDFLEPPGHPRQTLRYRADVAVVDTTEPWERGLPPVWTPQADDPLLARVAEPLLVEVNPVRERWVEIRDNDGRLVTVIEVVSPTNRTHGRQAYVEKRRNLVAAGVNVVEIDLLRFGAPIVDDLGVPARETTEGEAYAICASRRGWPWRREVYLCPIREPLPVIRIPLRETDPDVPLDVQSLVDRTYETGRYWKLDYTRDPVPAIAEHDRAWVDERLKAAELRP